MFLSDLLHGHAAPPPPDSTLIRWDPTFSVGNGLIDAEHREIIDVLNRLYADWASDAHPLNLKRELDHLDQIVRTHFTNEEEVLAKHHFPKLDEHRQEHEALLAQLRHIRAQNGAGRRNVEAKLLRFARKLVLAHVLDWDMDARDFMHG